MKPAVALAFSTVLWTGCLLEGLDEGTGESTQVEGLEPTSEVTPEPGMPTPEAITPLPTPEDTPWPTPDPVIPKTVTYAGRVVCWDGRPVPGGLVRVYGHLPLICEPMGACGLDDPTFLAETGSGEDGGFQVTVTAGAVANAVLYLLAEPAPDPSSSGFCGAGYNVATEVVPLEDTTDLVLEVTNFIN